MKVRTVSYTPETRIPIGAKRRELKEASAVWIATSDIRDQMQEHLIVFDLDARLRILERRTVAIGTAASVEVNPRDVFRGAIRNGAVSIVVVHNHPSGDPTPSREDLEITTRLRECGDLLGVRVVDHVVVCSGGFASLSDVVCTSDSRR